MHRRLLALAGRGARRIAIAAGMLGLAGTALAEGMYVVQLASVKSEARATAEWSRLRDRHAELLGDLNLVVERADLGDRGIFFRMQTGPFPNRATALDMCRQLKAAQLDCIVTER